MNKTPDIQTIRQALADVTKIRSVDEYRDMLRWAVDEIETLKGLHQHTGDQLGVEIKTSAYLRNECHALLAKLDAKTQELDLMRQVADTNADEALKARAERDAIRGQLAAKDTEIAKAMSYYEMDRDTIDRLTAQIAERDATIAKNDAFFREWASGEDKFQQFGGWDRIEHLQEDHKAMWTALTEILGNSEDEGARDCAMDCLQSLKEPNP